MDDGGLTMGAGCRHEDGLMGGVSLSDTPSPLRGEGWGGGESDASLVTLTCSPLSLTLPREGGGDSYLVSAAVTQTYEKSSIADQQSLTSSTNTPSPSTGEGWGEGEQRTVASADDGSTPTLALVELLAARLSPQAGKSTVIPPQGGGNHLWEARPRGDAAVRAPQTFDHGEGAAPTNTPSPLRGCGRVAAKQRGTHRRTPCGCEGWGLPATCSLASLVEWLGVPSGGEQCTAATVDAHRVYAHTVIAQRLGSHKIITKLSHKQNQKNLKPCAA
jgi:hypothetical protein